MTTDSRIAIVIPCFRVREQILQVIAGIGPEVGWIHVVDDACPEGSGAWVSEHCQDPRVSVVRHEHNQGVGGATLTGYRLAMHGGADVVVKLDGDGQMDPRLVRQIAGPLLAGQADYAKGNRFHRLAFVRGMPPVRLVGNALLSFLTKLSSGYWQIADPTNGFTAIRRELLAEMELERIARRYFFESDLLYHLNQLRAVVVDVPMQARYGDEPSSLRPLRVIGPFLRGHLRNTVRRIGYSYLLRGFSVASVELGLGLVLLLGGTAFGLRHWIGSSDSGVPATAGTVMLAALPIIIGVQMLLSWLNFDVAAEPRTPVHTLLGNRQSSQRQDGRH
ncbi:glycosyltransferase family 2 protein [Stenotrophomonas mori]|uniref:Glycosyltransferase family 2 protein n=1 Tax=Stenotrophomonas mori TaxID=2871096 RepID=A0ABT0SJH8_9GAMM|nr:glycosyltransferase family 2 protein [Stenotrophomonas mori]MCL7715266.1 glycosyltransferase family 2 protein [Stenotrophomonas mori]